MICSPKLLGALVAAFSVGMAGACGDVTSDLITRDLEQPDAQQDAQDATQSDEQDAAPDVDASEMNDASLDTSLPQDGGCSDNADCTLRELALCHPETVRCVECVTDAHCGDIGERCSRDLGACAAPCASAGDCPRDEPICDEVIGFCVECLSDDECSRGKLCRNFECTTR